MLGSSLKQSSIILTSCVLYSVGLASLFARMKLRDFSKLECPRMLLYRKLARVGSASASAFASWRMRCQISCLLRWCGSGRQPCEGW